MLFKSLQTPTIKRSFTEATLEGLAPDRGLYFPETLPKLSSEIWTSEGALEPWELGALLLAPLCKPDLSADELQGMLREVLSFPLPLQQLDDRSHLLELFHGPTAAFKDVGARFLARVIAARSTRRLTVLVATSGDTGSAVAQGFVGLPHIDVVILYPSGRISEIQERQLTTVGRNVTALEVKGSFDDCQAMVKRAFLDLELRRRRPLTSANSINIARWLPQSIYYAWVTHQLQRPVHFSVPSGNVGNIAAGLLATRLGMPCLGFIAATNTNDGLARHLQGEAFRPRPSLLTLSNAMDVGDPSNLTRLWALCDGDLDRLRREVWGVSVSDAETLQTIREVAETYNYLMCPHTAVGWRGWRLRQESLSALHDQRDHQGVILATAHPAKFSETVYRATGRSPALPQQLSACLHREMRRTPIEARDQDLKRYLLDSASLA